MSSAGFAAQAGGQSLQRKLLLSLLPALLVLILIDTTILYHVAQGFVQQQFDNALYDSAHDILHVIRSEGSGTHSIDLPRLVREVILSDPYDKIFYSIVDADGHVLSGQPGLVPTTHAKVRAPLQSFFFSRVQGRPVRVASLVAEVNLGGAHLQPIRIEVAQTLKRRTQLKARILTGIVVPQLLLVLLAAGLVWFGIGRGLSPLRDLELALGQRSSRDLRPIRLTGIPDEVRALVTAVNSLLEQLSGVLESQNRFVADAAHQLRTPIAGIQAQLALAQSDAAHVQSSLAQAYASVQRLSHLTNQLLSLARSQPEVARTILVRSVDLQALAQEATTEMVPAAYRKDIDIGFESEGKAVMVEGEPQRLTELLNNLIDNAVRYTSGGGRVTVAVANQGDRVLLSVQDDGPGIPGVETERVFERFHRVIGSGEEGSGLGLAIVREIAQLHHAEVHLVQPREGKGTRVEVVFRPTSDSR